MGKGVKIPLSFGIRALRENIACLAESQADNMDA